MFECFCDNTPIVMAIANDFSYDDIFAYQLREKLKSNNFVIGISGSGNSENVIRIVEYAKGTGIQVIGITGNSGETMMELADYKMHVNIDDMQITEDVHMIFEYMVIRVFSKSKSIWQYRT
ncbi:MAG: SIS domain-containing protein [Clostridiales bacterium]|nr:SIS domain-containing protein [Clostridiales bacterium]